MTETHHYLEMSACVGILSVNEKLPVSKFRYVAMATFTFMFLVNDRLVWRDKTVLRALVHMIFIFFVVYKNLKSSFSEDNMPVHALDVFIENDTKMV